MVKINSFFAIRPEKKIAHKVTTRAYADYSQNDIKIELKNNQYSFLNIIKQNNTKNQTKKYELIRKKISDFEKNKILNTEKQKSIYVYRQTEGKRDFVGIICTIELKDYIERKIKIHEHTIKKRESLFAQYLAGTKIHAEPVLLTYNSNISYIQKKHMSNENLIYSFKTKDNTHHSVWQIKEQREIQKIQQAFSKIEHLYIADGHHRMASSARNQPQGECLAYILPKKSLITYPFHRSVKIDNKLLKKFKNNLTLKKIKHPIKNTNKIQCLINNKWHQIIDNENKDSNNLMIEKITNDIFPKIFNIIDERKSKNVTFIPGNQSIISIEKKWHKKQEILFILKPITIEKILELAQKNQTTPAKSTFIIPKIPSGLIMMKIDDL